MLYSLPYLTTLLISAYILFQNNYTALILAAEIGQLAIVSILIARGAALDMQDKVLCREGACYNEQKITLDILYNLFLERKHGSNFCRKKMSPRSTVSSSG